MKEPKLKNLKIDRNLTKRVRSEAKSPKAKVRVTIHFDEDLLDEIKELAREMASPYQTLMNKILRDSLLDFRKREDRLARIEREIDEIKRAVGIKI